MRSRVWKGIFAALGMLILILDAKTALQGGLDGIRVCILTVIPVLFPFFVLSILLTSSLSGWESKIFRPIGKLCRMPSGSEILLILGLLGGYPTGAQAVSQAYHSGQLTRKDAQRLLGFCSNAGPSFLFGIASLAFQENWIPWVLWMIHIVSAILTGFLLPGNADAALCRQYKRSVSIPQAVEQSVKIMAKVCAWIVLFRIVLTFCDHWFGWFMSCEARVIFTGILELANGCLLIQEIQSTPLRFIVCAAMLSFGGISVAMQTLSVTGNLGFGFYLKGKALQTAFSVILAWLFQSVIWQTDALLPSILLFVSVILLFILRKRKNNSRNPAKVIV